MPPSRLLRGIAQTTMDQGMLWKSRLPPKQLRTPRIVPRSIYATTGLSMGDSTMVRRVIRLSYGWHKVHISSSLKTKSNKFAPEMQPPMVLPGSTLSLSFLVLRNRQQWKESAIKYTLWFESCTEKIYEKSESRTRTRTRRVSELPQLGRASKCLNPKQTPILKMICQAWWASIAQLGQLNMNCSSQMKEKGRQRPLKAFTLFPE